MSSHQEVRDRIRAIGLPYTVVVPHIKLKDEYIKRFYERDADYSFIKNIEKNWDYWIGNILIEESNVCVLDSGTFLSDIIFKI